MPEDSGTTCILDVVRIHLSKINHILIEEKREKEIHPIRPEGVAVRCNYNHNAD